MNEDSGYTLSEKRAGTRYMWEFGIGMALFLVLFLLLPNWWHTEEGTWVHVVKTLLPILPLVWAAVAVGRHVDRIDEMQRAIFFRSFTFGFAVSMLAAIVVALLRGGGINVEGGEWVIFIAGMMGWSLAIPVCSARTGR